ncbi:MAG: hypothetical protein ORN28_08460 [Rhodoferax sp.]|nr:hypothetical protein [Rhodoferax sp.]
MLALLLVCAGVPVLLYGLYLPASPFVWVVVASYLVCGALALTDIPIAMRMGKQYASEATLRWDGECWHLMVGQVHPLKSLTCILDLQRWVLLYVESDSGKRRWLCLKSRTMNGAWRAMRRAIAANKIHGEAEPSALPG